MKKKFSKIQNREPAASNHKDTLSIDYSPKELIEMDARGIEEIYNFSLVCDQTRTKENIQEEINFELRLEPLLKGTSFNAEIETLAIEISDSVLQNMLNSFNICKE